MVSEARLTWEERCDRDRERRIKIALERGDSEAAQFFRTMDYGTEADHADDAEEIRLSNEAAAATPDWRNQRDFNDELDEMYPEDARLFNQLDELSPDWGTHLGRLPELYPDSAEFLRRLDEQLPEAAQWFREWQAELRLD